MGLQILVDKIDTKVSDTVAYRRDEMWSEGRYEYERLPRERLPPRIHSDESAKFLHFQQTGNQISLNRDDYHRVVNVAPKKPPLLDRPAEGSYSRYDDYSHVDYRDYEEGRSFAHERRSGPPHRGEEPGYRWPREDYSISRQPEYRDIRDGLRRKSFYPSHYLRERSPHKRDSPFFRESPVSRRDSPHSRSGSSVSSRSYSPERSKAYSFHQSQHSRSMSSLHKRNISQQGKERPSAQSLKTSRDTSPSGSTAVPSSKVLDKSSRLSEKELAEAASKWAAEKSEKADESNLPEITEYDAGSSAPLYVERTEETETNITDSTELYEDNQLLGRSKAIATKTKEIEQVYRQDCETFGMVVKMLIDKDPSLEKSIQFALRQNLHEIGERCIEELKHFIAEYDAANQELAESFKEGAY
ncbi:periphilin-1 isoform X3 [Mauremys reevesii]|uniref:periphilin-1 isoform X3 n=1 Tax=Mauremys reevesii TaxID=260615 RepID=UPI00193FCC7F|nr:periphilin-1 isoform X3 [Mauremys reevesii]